MAAGRGGLDCGCVRRKRSWTRGLWAKGGDNRRGGGRGPLPGCAARSGRRRSSGPLPGSGSAMRLARLCCDSGETAWRDGARSSPCPTALKRQRCNGGAATAVRRRCAFGLATLRRGSAMSLVLDFVRLRCNDGAMARSIWSGGAATAARRRCATALVRPLPGGAARSARWLCNSGTTARRDRARPGSDHRIVLLSLQNWKY